MEILSRKNENGMNGHAKYRGALIIVLTVSMMMWLCLCPAFSTAQMPGASKEWIRINQLGYQPGGVKVAVWCSQTKTALSAFRLMDARTGKEVFTARVLKVFGQYGPFESSARLNFTAFKGSGRYYLMAGKARSPVFQIGEDVYKGAADFCLAYLRQQRCGFNPFLKDSCHTRDGYTMYGPMADSTHIDMTGGWHDASDYLQYSSTTANATWHLLAAYRDFPSAFADKKQASGLEGSNQVPDILDEARWGLNFLLKLHPRPDWMFNQVADDRDHHGMRLPVEDSFYGKGIERPVYFISGQPQQRGKFMNHTTGTSSTAGKFAGAFALGTELFGRLDKTYADDLKKHAYTALAFAQRKPGVTQTVSVVSPYIYAEDNWVDDMELAFAALARLKQTNKQLLDSAIRYAQKEPVTPWMYRDTANHYQYYPFINLGHYELARQLEGNAKKQILEDYRKGIQDVWQRAKDNAFYRGVPFIWCSNNLTVSFAIQCYWYRQLSGDRTFSALEQANFDWLFGLNPWGTSMVYGLPASGDTPADPHSAFTHIGHYPIDGGLVDGPVYGSIYNNLIGIQLSHADSYAPFQSGLAVYHDDYGDYSTNEPTMDGTASLVYLLAAKQSESQIPAVPANSIVDAGAVIRGDSTEKEIALVFTADSFSDGARKILRTLKAKKAPGSFFFTGNFYGDPHNAGTIKMLKKADFYLGPHSDKHLLYAPWDNRDRLLVTKDSFVRDLSAVYDKMDKWGIRKKDARYFLPPYEWHNDSIAKWAAEFGLQLVNFTPGTGSNADYTTPDMGAKYKSSAQIMERILQYENRHQSGLNGFLLLTHFGTDPRRTDKFYDHLGALIDRLKQKGYDFVRVDQLLKKK